jgi:hypothetical protein
MGLSYDCLVFPAPGYCTFAPSADVYGRVVAALVDAGWLEPNADTRGFHQPPGKGLKPFKVKSLGASDVTSALGKLSGSYHLHFGNRRDEGDPTPFEEDKSGVFRAAYCEDAYLGVSDVPLLIEDQGHPSDVAACPACKESAVVYRGDQPKVSDPSLLMGGACFLPPKCPHCRKPLDPEKLSMELHQAADRKCPARESAPFFRFSLWMLAVESRSPDVKRIKLDPSLPALLKKICGVPFRSFGRLEWS